MTSPSKEALSHAHRVKYFRSTGRAWPELFALATVLFAMTTDTCTAADQPARVEVLLRPEVKGGVSYRLRVPQNYFIRLVNQREASTTGTDLLGLWAVYPGFEGMNAGTMAALYNQAVPNNSVQFFLGVSIDSAHDWATQKLNAALAEPDYSPVKIRASATPAVGGVREYDFVNSKDHRKAYFVTDADGTAYVDCSGGPVCKAFRIWKGKLTLRYHFYGGQIPDLAQLDRDLVRLVESFDVTAAGRPDK